MTEREQRFLESQAEAPVQIILDLDATDDPLHGQQEGRFFHGYGACPRAGEAGPGGLLLLSATLHILRAAPAGGEATAVEHRWGSRRDGGSGADHRSHPPSLAADAHPAAARL